MRKNSNDPLSVTHIKDLATRLAELQPEVDKIIAAHELAMTNTGAAIEYWSRPTFCPTPPTHGDMIGWSEFSAYCVGYSRLGDRWQLAVRRCEVIDDGSDVRVINVVEVRPLREAPPEVKLVAIASMPIVLKGIASTLRELVDGLEGVRQTRA